MHVIMVEYEATFFQWYENPKFFPVAVFKLPPTMGQAAKQENAEPPFENPALFSL